MTRREDIPEAIYADEIVSFLAGRYHATPRQVLQRFLEQSGPAFDPSSAAFHLEENEMSILRDMLERDSLQRCENREER